MNSFSQAYILMSRIDFMISDITRILLSDSGMIMALSLVDSLVPSILNTNHNVCNNPPPNISLTNVGKSVYYDM